ncbi:MAG: CotH kinase family protein [Paludibacteraceae bacterium]|nr:CotH kinase family protein [Paludibacteraceae bacterium]
MKKLFTITVAVLCTAMAFAEVEPVITAWRTSVNTNDATDFASMYVSDLGSTITGNAGYETGEVTYMWEKSANGSSDWAPYADGLGSETNNIRPIKAGYYRCVVTLTPAAGEPVVVNSNAIQVTATPGSTVSISSNIPVISIRTDAEVMPDCSDPLGSLAKMYTAKQKRSADCKIIWNGEKTDGSANIYSGADFDAHNGKLYYDKKIRINYRGSSSLTKARKNYAFVCGDDNCGDNGKWVKGKEKMFKLSDKKDKDWILYSSNDDNTWMRNKLQLDLYEEMTGNWNSHGRYAKVYINGEDKGLYVFMEKNKDGEARINVDENTGFIFKYDKTDMVDRYPTGVPATDVQGNDVEQNKCTFISKYVGQLTVHTYEIDIDHAFEVVYPEYGDFSTAEWDAKMTTIKGKISAFEDAVKDNDYATLRTLIDYESFADYFIIEELAKNVDGYRISQYFHYKDDNAKLMAEPLWDTELGLGNHEGSVNDNNLLCNESRVTTDDFPIPFWWTGKTGGGKHGKSGTSATGGVNQEIRIGSSNGLLGDACFKAKVKQRWAQQIAAGAPLSESNIQAKLSAYETSSGKSSSAFSGWLIGNNSRTTKLGSIINGWSVSDYVTSVSSSFDGEAPSVLEKQVAMDGSVTMTATATASQGSASLLYSWQRSDDGETNWITVVDDEATASHTFTGINESGYYRCKAKSSDCDCIKYTSDNVLHVVVDQVKVVCK